MILAIKALTTQFSEFKEAFYASGGSRKGLKYPENLRAGAVAYLRSSPGRDIAVVAKAIGVGYAALKDWDSRTPAPRASKMQKAQAFVPLSVVADVNSRERPAPLTTGVSVTCRQITVHLASCSDPSLLQSIINSLQLSAGGTSI